jgi:hypothetical protein
VVAREGVRVPVERPHVVDADVERAEVVARVRRRVGLEGGELLAGHVGRPRPVACVARVREAERARGPQRPALQRHAPLELAAAVGDRVAEGEDAEATGRGVGGGHAAAQATGP